jgi:hypothetical protein
VIELPAPFKLDRKLPILQRPLVQLQSKSLAHTIKYTITFFANVSASLDITSREVTVSSAETLLLYVDPIKSIKTVAVSVLKDFILLDQPVMSAHLTQPMIYQVSPAYVSLDTNF